MYKYILLLVISFFSFSFSSHAGADFSGKSSAIPHTPASCSSLTACLAEHKAFTDSSGRTFAPTGSYRFLTYTNPLRFNIVMKYLPSYTANLVEYQIIWTYTDDCYVTASVLQCGLACNSESTCFAVAASQCPFLAQFTYVNPSSWSRTCTTIIEGSLEGEIGQEDNYSVIATGSTGLTGATGADGANGLDGIDGVIGTDGKDGTDGIDGEIGLTGADGIDGIDGIDGTNGTDGINGTNGFNGLDGSQGPIGQTGARGEAGEVDQQVLEDLQRIDTLNIDRINNLELNDFEQDNLLSDFGTDLGTAESDLFTLFQKDLVLETGQALIDADVETNEQEIVSLSAALANFVATPPVDVIDGIDGIDGTNGTDGEDGTNGTDGLTGAAGVDGTDGINGINGLAGADGENVDTAAVVSAINTSNDFLKTSQSLSANTGAFDSFSSLFGTSQIAIVEAEILSLQEDIKLENNDFLALIKAKFSFDSTSSGYQTRMLDIGTWGSHDVSLSRFAEYFGGLANIVYFFAVLFSLYIVLSGVRI
jgi:hypothetical protein